MLCHIERGRVIPAEDTLRALLTKLKVPAEEAMQPWRAWRNRGRIRDRLWIAVNLEDGPLMQQLLDEGGHLLVPFERQVYTGLAGALTAGERTEAWAAVREVLEKAAQDENRPVLRSSRSGPRAGISQGGRKRDVYAGAWTHIDKARALVTEAKAQWLAARHFTDDEGALYWKQVMALYLWETIWKGAQ
jgi:hypothetical protein